MCACVCNVRRFYRLRELYEADFHKPGIYGSGRVWANAWDVFRRAPSRVGRGRQAAVDFVACFRWGGIFSIIFSFERTRSAASMRPPCLIYLSTSISHECCSRNSLFGTWSIADLYCARTPTRRTRPGTPSSVRTAASAPGVYQSFGPFLSLSTSYTKF